MGNLLRRSHSLGWGVGDQALSSLTNFALGLITARTVTAYEFGAFSLAFATFTAGLGLARGQHPERCARVLAASLRTMGSPTRC